MEVKSEQRELGVLEKEFLLSKLNDNEKFIKIKKFLAEQGLLTEAELKISRAYQVMANIYSGVTVEVSLGEGYQIWYSKFDVLNTNEGYEQVIGVHVQNNLEKQYEVKDGVVKLSKELSVDEEVVEQDEVSAQDNCWPHGNWCGPGCSGPGAPVDALDKCCMYHDNCYAINGYSSCQCDYDLLDCTRGMSGWAANIVRTTFILAQIAGYCV
ncbi:hypothetical protein ABER99_20295 [Paenibacillus glucanolyticus]|jgi:hypothetical protein|uniref:Phospholipase A2 domain-containing protein n=1 Tax=Paenibacillus glucanolyticus TaxID=59843 RepID=A0A163GJR1_9BACL|nr:hypothetical protein [Paenibacillus glucanolyticus]KZS45009.1 hypothetical protein AWU65_03240 [Paenibacillus glucanolyticus]OMF66754.1 hypothetical protein BK142_29475 [Paenibacillus glucanolyticus]